MGRNMNMITAVNFAYVISGFCSHCFLSCMWLLVILSVLYVVTKVIIVCVACGYCNHLSLCCKWLLKSSLSRLYVFTAVHCCLDCMCLPQSIAVQIVCFHCSPSLSRLYVFIAFHCCLDCMFLLQTIVVKVVYGFQSLSMIYLINAVIYVCDQFDYCSHLCL